MLSILIILFVVESNAARPPFIPSNHPTTKLYTVAENGRSEAELLLLDSISGNLARDAPVLYRVSSADWRNDTDDSYGTWLMELETNGGIVVDDAFIEKPLLDIVNFFVTSSQEIDDLSTWYA